MRFEVTEESMKITGRTLFVDGVRYLGYSGSSVTFTFTGKKACACIWSDEKAWDETLKARIAVFVNGGEEPVQRICLDQEEAVYTLYESEKEEQVTITIMKYSETAFAMCGIRYIEVDAEELMAPPAKKSRRVEIIGDSITCGYGVEAPNELCPFHTATENPTKSYSLLTAKALDAEVNLVSWSGNGIITSYVEETATEPKIETALMPELYKYTDASGSLRLCGGDWTAVEKWDFGKFIPDIILINLGTNDCSWCKDIQERKDNYRVKYIEFLKYIRANNPTSEILCILGTMDQRVLPDLERAVKEFCEQTGDKATHFLGLPAQDANDGYGADWHPSPKTQRMTADLVVAEVKRIMNW